MNKYVIHYHSMEPKTLICISDTYDVILTVLILTALMFQFRPSDL